MERLNEVSRANLLDKSKSASITKSYGTTRYERRSKQSVTTSVNTFDTIDFNSLFKADQLKFIAPVHGETNNYSVIILFEKICTSIKEQLISNNYKIEYKVVYRALINAINRSDIYVNCTCSDFKYRLAYYATKDSFNAGAQQLVPARITNPNDTAGAGCKHILKVLADLDWVVNLATSITNYINYMADEMPDLYTSIIFPAIFGMSYAEAVAKGIVEEEQDIPDIDLAPEESPDDSTEPEEVSTEHNTEEQSESEVEGNGA